MQPYSVNQIVPASALVDPQNGNQTTVSSSGALTVATVQPLGSGSLSIAAGQSVSAAVQLSSQLLGLALTSGSWTAAALTIELSVDGATWLTSAVDSAGSPILSWSAVTASQFMVVDPTYLLAVPYIRLRSGTSAAPVVQTAGATFTLFQRPLA